MNIVTQIALTATIAGGVLLGIATSAKPAEPTLLMQQHPATLTPEQLQQRRRDTERFYSGGADLRANHPFASKRQDRVTTGR